GLCGIQPSQGGRVRRWLLLARLPRPRRTTTRRERLVLAREDRRQSATRRRHERTSRTRGLGRGADMGARRLERGCGAHHHRGPVPPGIAPAYTLTPVEPQTAIETAVLMAV